MGICIFTETFHSVRLKLTLLELAIDQQSDRNTLFKHLYDDYWKYRKVDIFH